MTFDERNKKGKIGQAIVSAWLRNQGCVVYEPSEGAPHPFDMLVVSKNKKRIGITEVKTKPRRQKYPDTGIDIKDREEYLRVSLEHNLRVFIFFVDEDERRIYGNYLDTLLQSINENGHIYPWEFAGIIYFPLSRMIRIEDLSEEQCKELRALRDSPYERRLDGPGI